LEAAAAPVKSVRAIVPVSNPVPGAAAFPNSMKEEATLAKLPALKAVGAEAKVPTKMVKLEREAPVDERTLIPAPVPLESTTLAALEDTKPAMRRTADKRYFFM